MDVNQPVPYRQLGKKLRELRDGIGESLAEASGAVEIDVKQLASFELGRNRPTEDVLLLLISHFGAKDDAAIKLWQMAGYEMERIPASHMASSEDNAAMLINSDQRVLFTDVVDVIVNNYGVIMNFMQSGSSSKQPQTVSRVGMSREHAKSVLKILQMTLSQTEQNPGQTTRKLSAPENQNQDQNT